MLIYTLFLTGLDPVIMLSIIQDLTIRLAYVEQMLGISVPSQSLANVLPQEPSCSSDKPYGKPQVQKIVILLLLYFVFIIEYVTFLRVHHQTMYIYMYMRHSLCHLTSIILHLASFRYISAAATVASLVLVLNYMFHLITGEHYTCIGTDM